MTKKTKDLKITNEELSSIQDKVKSINTMQMQIGGLEVQKSVAVATLKAFQDEMGVIQKQLEDKYGKVSVNLETGIIKEIPKDASDKKN